MSYVHKARLKYTLLALMFAGVAPAQSFSDGFEGASLDPFWSLHPFQQYGTINVSTEQPHTGLQSLKFASQSGGNRVMHIQHQFASPSKGNFSIWYYDYAPGSETLYEYIAINNSTNPNIGAGIGVSDYDAYCYNAGVSDASGVQHGPNASCGIYPQTSTTSVARTLGWRRFEINVLANGIILKIDGNTVFTYNGDLSFDRVSFFVGGPSWRPNTVVYIDDFSFTPLGPAYSLCLLYDPSKAVRSGATIPIKLQLCDGSGTNLSSANIVLHATSITQVSTDTSGAVQDAGDANADNDFRYDAELGGAGGYIFNLKTTGLTTGTYRLNFTIGADPAPYAVEFQVK